MIKKLISVFILTCLQQSLFSEQLSLWISSFQDQVYYEKMAEMFAKKNKGFELEVSLWI